MAYRASRVQYVVSESNKRNVSRPKGLIHRIQGRDEAKVEGTATG